MCIYVYMLFWKRKIKKKSQLHFLSELWYSCWPLRSVLHYTAGFALIVVCTQRLVSVFLYLLDTHSTKWLGEVAGIQTRNVLEVGHMFPQWLFLDWDSWYELNYKHALALQQRFKCSELGGGQLSHPELYGMIHVLTENETIFGPTLNWRNQALQQGQMSNTMKM